MFRSVEKLLVVTVFTSLAVLGTATAARAGARQDVRIEDRRTGIPLHSDTYVVNTNPARGITVTISKVVYQGGKEKSRDVSVYKLAPGEEKLIGHSQDSLLTTKFAILGAVYNGS